MARVHRPRARGPRTFVKFLARVLDLKLRGEAAGCVSSVASKPSACTGRAPDARSRRGRGRT